MTEKFRFLGRKTKDEQGESFGLDSVGRMWDSLKEKAEHFEEKVMLRHSFFLYVIIFLALCLSAKLDFGYQVVVNGQSFVVVRSQEMAKNAVFTAYDEIVAVKGTEYKFEKGQV